MGKQIILIFNRFLPGLFMISDAENKLLGVLILNGSGTEEGEKLPACWRVELEESSPWNKIFNLKTKMLWS